MIRHMLAVLQVRAHEHRQTGGLGVPLLLKAQNGSETIGRLTILPELELRFDPEHWHTDTHHSGECSTTILDCQVVHSPWICAMSFVPRHQCVEDIFDEFRTLYCLCRAIRMHDRVVPSRHCWPGCIPRRRNVRVRPLEDQ